MSNAVERKVGRTLEEFHMLPPPGGRVIVGLSGGADSICLAHFLWSHGVPLLAAHLNHGLRGGRAAADEEFVRDWCASRGVPLRVRRENIAARAAESGRGLEECGRDARYAFFQSLAGPEDRIATAHTRSDLAETVLLRLARGAGARGLSGIPPVRGNIIRPLYEVSREEVEGYCAAHGLAYVTDESNFSREYARNRIRLDAVPALRSVNPAWEEAVLRAARSLAEDEAYLSACAARELERARRGPAYDAGVLASLVPALRSRALALALRRATGLETDALHLRQAAALFPGGGAVTVPGGAQLRVERGLLTVVPRGGFPALEPVPAGRFPARVNGGRTAEIRVLPMEEAQNPQKIHNLLFQNLLDYDTILFDISWRTRREGDRFRPAGQNVTRSLKNLFQEAGIPPALRGCVLLLEGKGGIVWMEGFGAAEEYRVRPSTKRVAVIEIKENEHAE